MLCPREKIISLGGAERIAVLVKAQDIPRQGRRIAGDIDDAPRRHGGHGPDRLLLHALARRIDHDHRRAQAALRDAAKHGIEMPDGSKERPDPGLFKSIDELLNKLNALASKYGVGTIDIIENRLVGMKSRGVYETPGGTLLYEAHKALERLILDRNTMHYKKLIAERYAELCYDGLWFSPLMKALNAFVDVTQETVSGTVKMKLYKGSCHG